jgi:fatty acid desaturase
VIDAPVLAGGPVDDRIVRRVLLRHRRSDDRRAALILLRTWLAIGATIALAVHVSHPLASLIAVVVIATRQRALIAIMHTASHGVFFRRRRWNTALEPLYAYPNLHALSLYKPDHVIHHHDVGVGAPGALDYLNVEMGLAPGGFARRTFRVFVRPLLGYDGIVATLETLRELIQNPRALLRIASLWVPVTAAAALSGGLRHLLLYWVVPMVWLRPALGLWSEMSDHFGAESGARDHVGWFQRLFVSVYGLHHWIHHKDPRVPCYMEAKAAEALAQIGVKIETTRTFREFLLVAYGEAVTRIPPVVRPKRALELGPR